MQTVNETPPPHPERIFAGVVEEGPQAATLLSLPSRRREVWWGSTDSVKKATGQ